MLKRAARGHEDSGVLGTGQGELALDCRMCPQPDWNLPPGFDEINWDEMDEDQRCVVKGIQQACETNKNLDTNTS